MNYCKDKTDTQATLRSFKIIWISKLSELYHFKTSRLELSNALIRRGHDVKLIMEKKIGEKKSNNKDIIYFPTICNPVLSGLLFGLILVFYFPFIIWREHPDLLMIDETTVWLPFALGLKIFRIPLILDVRTLPVEYRRPIQFSISLHLSKYFNDGFTMITPELRKLLSEKYNLESKKIGIWSSGVSINNFTKLDVNNRIIGNYRQANIFILMYHGSYSPTRGIENLIKSIARLKDPIRKNIKLLIIGIQQGETFYLSDLCKENGIEENVEFISKVEYKKIPEYIFSSDVGIIPLPPDNKWWHVSAPLKTLEYLAMSKPIIVTDIPFHQRIFEKGKCGVLVKKNTPEILAKAITNLYNNKEKLKEMGKKGRDIVEKYYTWDCKALEVEKFLKKILAH